MGQPGGLQGRRGRCAAELLSYGDAGHNGMWSQGRGSGVEKPLGVSFPAQGEKASGRETHPPWLTSGQTEEPTCPHTALSELSPCISNRTLTLLNAPLGLGADWGQWSHSSEVAGTGVHPCAPHFWLLPL